MRKRCLCALFALFCLLLTACTAPAVQTTAPPAATSTGTGSPPPATADTAVFYVGEEPVTALEFGFHFAETVTNFFSSGAYAENGVDPNTPLSEQQYPDGEMTWEEAISQSTRHELHTYLALYQEAKAKGIEMYDEEYTAVMTFIENLQTYANHQGVTYEEVLMDQYGADMTPDAVYTFLERYYLGVSYEYHLRETLEITDEKIREYYEANQADANIPEGNAVDIRHILMTNKQSAQDVLEKFEAGDKSEQSFIELVERYSEDTASVEDGGLYTSIVPQNTKDSFDNFEKWCFDTARQPGDYALLDVESGEISKFDIIYFVQKGDPIWELWSFEGILEETVQTVIDKYPYVAGKDS